MMSMSPKMMCVGAQIFARQPEMHCAFQRMYSAVVMTKAAMSHCDRSSLWRSVSEAISTVLIRAGAGAGAAVADGAGEDKCFDFGISTLYSDLA
jgi:hypothetical protein